MIDTALLYGNGASERMIGQWLKARGGKKDVLNATKGAHPDLADRTPRLNRADLAVFAFTSQARGFFSKAEELGLDAIVDWVKKMFLNEMTLARLERARMLAKQKAVTVAAIVLAYLLNHPVPAFPIVSFSCRDIRVTVQQIGCWDPGVKPAFQYHNSEIFSTAAERVDFSNAAQLPDYGLFECADDWSSCAYFYLDRPENELPEIDPVDKRIV